MALNKIACMIAGGLLAGSVAGAQDIHFSQFYETSILRNPSLTGFFTGDFKVGALYRNQWSSISAPFQTGLFNVETRLPINGESKDFFSIGLLAYYDKAGSIDLKTISVYPSLSFSKSVDEAHNSFISAGFTGGYIQRSFDPAKMTFNTQYQNGSYNPGNASGEQIPDPTLQNWDLGAGVSFGSNAGEDDRVAYVLGVSGYHFTKPKRSFYASENLVRLDMKWNGNAGLSCRVNQDFVMQFQANYTSQGVYNEFIIGGLLGWKHATTRQDEPPLSLYGGVFYRVKDAVIPTVKVDYRRYTVAMSYDINTSTLKAGSNGQGGFELSVSMIGLLSNPTWERGRVICPDLW